MEKRRIALNALNALLCLACLSIARAVSGAEASPHPGWQDVLRLVSSSPGPIDANTVEHYLRLPMARKGQAADDYHAWIAGEEGIKGPSSVQLLYMPSRLESQRGLHDSSLQIFVREIECVTPDRVRADLLQAGFTATSPRTPTTTVELYRWGTHRSVRVTYPRGPAGAARQLQSIRHHATDEDRRCVGDILVTETG